MDYDRIINQMISEFDLKSGPEREKAFEKCIEYADQHLDCTWDYNPFLQKAADRLAQLPVRMDIARRMLEQSGDERLHISYSKQSGLELTGNACGLKYLSEVIKNLSQATMNGEHAHFLCGQRPLYGDSRLLTIYLEDDDWFVKHGEVERKGKRKG